SRRKHIKEGRELGRVRMLMLVLALCAALLPGAVSQAAPIVENPGATASSCYQYNYAGCGNTGYGYSPYSYGYSPTSYSPYYYLGGCGGGCGGGSGYGYSGCGGCGSSYGYGGGYGGGYGYGSGCGGCGSSYYPSYSYGYSPLYYGGGSSYGCGGCGSAMAM